MLQYHQGSILYLANLTKLRTFMCQAHLATVEAMGRQPGVVVFDAGSDGGSRKTIEQVVAIACRGKRPRCIVHGIDIGSLGHCLVTGLSSVECPTILELHDTWTNPETQDQFLRENAFDFAYAPYANALERYGLIHPNVRFFWHPNAVNVYQFREWSLEKRWDVLLYGRLDASFYPFRCRLARILGNASQLCVRLLPHPGYWDIGEKMPLSYFVGEALSKAINQSWIAIATCGKQQGLFFKYFEIAASGALVAGNLPQYSRCLWADKLLELREDQSDSEIVNQLSAALADKVQLSQRISTVQRYIQSNHSLDRASERFVGFVDKIVLPAGKRTSHYQEWDSSQASLGICRSTLEIEIC